MPKLLYRAKNRAVLVLKILRHNLCVDAEDVSCAVCTVMGGALRREQWFSDG